MDNQKEQITEITATTFVIIILFFNAIVLHDNPITLMYGICGLLYTVLAGKGKYFCYIFGIISSCLYGYLSLIHSLWGNALLNIGYYLPMQIIGLINWKKHINPETKSIYKTKLNTKERIIISIVSVTLCIIGYTCLLYTNDQHPVCDSVATMLSIVGMYLTVKRCIEQWIVWSIVNLSTLVMWCNIVHTDKNYYSTVLVWGCYLIIGIYFYFQWRRG